MNHVKIKEKARQVLKKNMWNYWKGSIVVGVTILIISSLLALIIANSNNELVNSILTFVTILLITPLTFGFTNYVMEIVRGDDFCLDDLILIYKTAIPIWVLTILVVTFTTLWSLLFIIPGIIATIRYSMTTYIYLDKNLETTECLQESKKLIYGYKKDYFIFKLSFLGWIVISCLTAGLLLIYVVPYIVISQIVYYDELKLCKKRLTK